MKNDEQAYARWLSLANDPGVSEAIRRQCRANMEAQIRDKMLEAFRRGTQQTLDEPSGASLGED